MNRENIINAIPKPSNRDVIIYDTSLKDLIDIDVFEEYNETLPIYKEKLKEYNKINEYVNKYKDMVNNIYLYKKNWTKEDYLYYLQLEKKNYSLEYKDIKKKEDNIKILQKKINLINSRIEIQLIREKKHQEEYIAKSKKEIDKSIDKIVNLEKNIKLQEYQLDIVNKNIEKNQVQFNEIEEIVKQLQLGECKCPYCNSKLKNISENSYIYRKTTKILENNSQELKQLIEDKKELENEISRYKDEIKKIRQDNLNKYNINSDTTNGYNKKSIEILKLEGERDKTLKNIDTLTLELDKDSKTKSSKFLEMKDKINKIETSIENLDKIEELKTEILKNKDVYNSLAKELQDLKEKLTQYKQFISIFYKIYEQKAAQFCGNGFKFKLFNFNDFDLIEICEIYFNTIKYESLNSRAREIVNEILKQKFLFIE